MAETPRIGILANPEKPGAAALLHDLVDRFAAAGQPVLLEEVSAALAGLPDGVPLAEFGEAVDRIVLLGGDGTLLWAVRELGAGIKPIAPINTGTLGFLTCATEGESGALVEALVSGDYTIGERLLIAGELEQGGEMGDTFYSLNEVAICRAIASRVIHVEAHVNGVFANRYTGDGLILSTPTGSTAYSLSAGGPLVSPEAKVFVLTPICPHSLANRPLVVDASSRLVLETPRQRDDLSLLVDGHLLAELTEPARVHLRQADFSLPLITLPHQDFYGVLHRKLGWTGTAAGRVEGER
ncbi:MAG TPA: NAD(+)/NADH kinase [Bacteroidia bacterium]|nr:NAD(+)/NADH kinase [Bacteroidia bacterium]